MADTGLDYYELLGLPRSATDVEIKKAYRKLAIKWHPDKNPEAKEEAEGMFKLVAEAYECISNPEKRALYDRYGHAGVKQGGGGGGRRGGGGGFSRGAPGVHSFHDAEEIFRQFFGNHDPFADFFADASFGGDPFGRGGQQQQHQFGGQQQQQQQFGGQPMRGQAMPGGMPHVPGMPQMPGMMGGFGGSFGGGGGGGQQQARDPFAEMMGGGFGGGGSTCFSSCSSFGGGGGGGCSQSTSTSTVVENGVRVTRKETSIRRADGSSSCTVEEERVHPNGQTERRTLTGPQAQRGGGGRGQLGFGGFGGF